MKVNSNTFLLIKILSFLINQFMFAIFALILQGCHISQDATLEHQQRKYKWKFACQICAKWNEKVFILNLLRFQVYIITNINIWCYVLAFSIIQFFFFRLFPVCLFIAHHTCCDERMRASSLAVAAVVLYHIWHFIIRIKKVIKVNPYANIFTSSIFLPLVPCYFATTMSEGKKAASKKI